MGGRSGLGSASITRCVWGIAVAVATTTTRRRYKIECLCCGHVYGANGCDVGYASVPDRSAKAEDPESATSQPCVGMHQNGAELPV